ncbi:MAG: AAA family ATPase [Candidatus Omnitrophica bacterium]|nr:AAA family ATPase [Candidatus Omnitrophota bacterium]
MRRIKMYMKMFKVPIIVAIIVIVLLILTVVGLSSLESFYRKMTIATMPLQFLMSGIHAGIFVFMYLIFLRGGFAKLDKAPIKGKDIEVKWKDVIGMDDAKQEAWEVVQLIRDRAKLVKVGGKVIKGLLMVGPPGCGKTYLAKAMATEARLPFISMSGSEFNEVFVGVGASRVRKLFKKARDFAYGYGGCIIFIDELDAIGRKRTMSWGGGGQETNATQNQLLVELDGLNEDANVVVVGATNAPEDSLDKALLRPGRFDRKLYVSAPGLEDREKIFEYYLRQVKTAEEINIPKLARRAVGKTPADISNLVKESAIIATRNRHIAISMKDISAAFERIDLGIKHKLTMTPLEKEMTAYHESGHLIVTYLLHTTEDVFKASIIPRGGALGVVYKNPREETITRNKDTLLADIKSSLGGFVAEKIVYGNTSNGVSSDFSKAMSVATDMIWRLGMGQSGLIGDYSGLVGIDPMSGQNRSFLSEKVKETLNEDTQKILKDCAAEVEELLTRERSLLDTFAKELLAKEELEYDEIEEIFKAHGNVQKRIIDK